MNRSLPSFILPLVAVILLTFAATPSHVFAVDLEVRDGFTKTNDLFVASTSKSSAHILMTKQPLAPGYYRFSAEYKTDGFEKLGQFAIDVKSVDGTTLSCYEWNGAVGDWSPLTVYLKVETPAAAQIRCGHWKQAKDGATLSLRNPKIERFKFADAVNINWLDDGNFDRGQVGYIPPDWFWKYASGRIEEEALVANTTYRSGKHVLRMTGGGEKERMLQSRAFPLPPNGTLELSVWARTDDGGKLAMHIVRDGWGRRAEKRFEPTPQWKKYTVRWPVEQEDRKWFFARMDKDKATSSVELADACLKWLPSGETKDLDVEIDPYAEAKKNGWQGAPGPNLLYNPDFELGGVGYYYDFSWPKKMADYESVRKAKPVKLLEGKGVDGGTCALLDGTSIRAYSFPVILGQTYTVSVDMRAESDSRKASAMIQAFDASWHAGLWQRVGNIPSDQWKRYSWTFRWTKANREGRAHVRFGGNGVLIDRVQLVEGKDGKEYKAPPVMLGLVYDRFAYFVRGRDKAQAKIKVVPDVKKDGQADILVEAKDGWGKLVWKREFKAPLNKTTLIPVDLPTERCGTIHVSLTATVDKKVAGIGINRYAIIDPPALQKTSLGKPGLAGVCQESFNYPVWLCQDHAKILTDLGIRLNRLFASVPSDLPLPIPAWFKEEILAKAKPFNNAGIDLVPCIEGIIPPDVAKANANLEMPKPEDLEKFGKYLGAYVDALKSGIKYWEIFNEPNLWRVQSGENRGKRTMWPAKYLEFQKVAYKTIKDIDPKLQVVCNALNNIRFDWIEEWMTLSGGKYMDIFSFHAYGLTNYFDKGPRLNKLLDKYGFKKPLLNTEKYYGTDVFYERNGWEETHRGYFLPHDKELSVAGWSIQHFVSHAAMGVPVCFFHSIATLSRRGPGGELFVYDFFSAYNAAIRFMVDAGKGKQVEMGPMVTTILFPDASKGPLAVVWATKVETDANMTLPGKFQAYDIMGNLYTSEQQAAGIRIAADPTYIRFPAGTKPADIERALTSSDIIGLGDPFSIDLRVSGPKQLTVQVGSRRNCSLDGTVKLQGFPKDWVADKSSAAFTNLQPGTTQNIPFAFKEIDLKSMETYKVSVIAERGEEFMRQDVTLRPLFVSPVQKIKVDGDLGDWKNANWVELGDNHTSTKFSQTLKRQGNKDLSAKLAVGCTDDAIMLAMVVTDDTHKPAESNNIAWQGDSVQIYFDQRNDATQAKANAADDIAYTLSLINGKAAAWIDKGAEGNYKGKANLTEGLVDADVQLVIKRVGDQTIYEAVFPKKQCLPDATLGKDSSIGFSLLINDNDGSGRKTGVTLAPKGSEPFGHPDQYRDLISQPE